MSSIVPSYVSINIWRFEDVCPYQNPVADVCMASISAVRLDSNLRNKFCGSDRHEECPFFLAKLLRKE